MATNKLDMRFPEPMRGMRAHLEDAIEADPFLQGASGVLAVADIDSGMMYWTLVNQDSYLREEVEGKEDANFLAIALQKAGTVMARGCFNTPPQVLYKGDTEWRGGISLHLHGRNLVIAFSGATEEQDERIARIALEYYGQFLQELHPQ
ncbi:MAG: hypothetical protein A3E94_01885 [Candidatus Zambryskibacteria bacterium RIFCSPHIGHO2_12_FULL_44_12b]|uniref:Uncharacterized protein n=1 Tax=Candidatus Zambryskibacteria bacterium RIFCSPLOWO2_01_FULL_45_21 TaxID=1802761 RepID=A0A1G2U0L7_9BACT|nr:MAG: hypothetical protein A3E94_01885 [Candidatus Zambryskibacteria bacterium RIFCSPHIGHO2_12_FULL_44_12b]OHB03058.1 MAG: hypothetical protein A3B14_00130 [Candidatus Zambryskibacteria bacterium RIFCSPLOWO2_01_FULL_45_21]